VRAFFCHGFQHYVRHDGSTAPRRILRCNLSSPQAMTNYNVK
jgi:hypothetical protein